MYRGMLMALLILLLLSSSLGEEDENNNRLTSNAMQTSTSSSVAARLDATTPSTPSSSSPMSSLSAPPLSSTAAPAGSGSTRSGSAGGSARVRAGLSTGASAGGSAVESGAVSAGGPASEATGSGSVPESAAAPGGSAPNVTAVSSLGSGSGENASQEAVEEVTVATVKQDLPPEGAAEQEHTSSMTIFFILVVLAVCILVIHLLLRAQFHYLPESVSIVLIGAIVGLIVKMLSDKKIAMNLQAAEDFPPTVFFLIMLPPIIFESGYNLHKGNFFQNIGSILLFAVVGTTISAAIVGCGIYVLGQAQVIYEFTLSESLGFGSLISAVDPVATIAIFNALEVDPVLNMMVFGESILNDAVAIVLTSTVLEAAKPAMKDMSNGSIFVDAVGRFFMMFFASAGIGVLVALASALLLKHLDLRKTPSLELCMMLIFSYLPYGLAEGVHLSGIMAILFCGIVMSHYTHFNLSPVTQIAVQQLFRTLAFMAETCVFVYLGLAIFSFHHVLRPAVIIWSIILILVARAANIFPLSALSNYFRETKINRKMQFIMWFSGLRGAIAYALALHTEFENEEKRRVLVSTTLIIVLFTLLVLGGSTMPLLKFLKANKPDNGRRYKRPKEITLSKTQEMGSAIDSSEHLSEFTEDEADMRVAVLNRVPRGFARIDMKYLVPFFTRRFTQQELRDGRARMTALTDQWYQDVRAVSSDTDELSDLEPTNL